MPVRTRACSPSLLSLVSVALLALALASPARAADSITVGGRTFVNKGLVGVGRLQADLQDKFGETFGSGSGLALDARSWTRTSTGYQGTFFLLPDRGFNVGGTTGYRARLNTLSVTFTPLTDPTAVRWRSARTVWLRH